MELATLFRGNAPRRQSESRTMNCLNCGAPLELADGRTVLTCDYCHSHRRLSVGQGDGDRVVSLERPSGIDCPRCHTELFEAAVDGRRAKSCPECLGILFESPIFAEVARNRRAAYRGPDLLPQPIERDELQETIACPVCQQAMDVHPHGGSGLAVIDSCPSCHLVWLDNAELTSIERTPGRR